MEMDPSHPEAADPKDNAGGLGLSSTDLLSAEIQLALVSIPTITFLIAQTSWGDKNRQALPSFSGGKSGRNLRRLLVFR